VVYKVLYIFVGFSGARCFLDDKNVDDVCKMSTDLCRKWQSWPHKLCFLICIWLDVNEL